MIFSVEMSRNQILRRVLAAVGEVAFPRVRDPRSACESDMEALRQASSTVAKWQLHIIDDSSITIEKLAASARLAIRRDGVKLVCVDYAQMVAATGRDERLRVAAVSRGLTRLAKDEGVPVMLLSQLARADRANPNRRPTMNDLRESSQLENDAAAIVLLHREWDEREGRLSADAEIIAAKQRSERQECCRRFSISGHYFLKDACRLSRSKSHSATNGRKMTRPSSPEATNSRL